MGYYRDWMSKTDLSDQVYFPYEPKGSVYPKQTKNIIEEHSVPSHTDPALGTVTWLPSVRSVKDNGIDPNSGEFNLSGSHMEETDYLKFKAFFDTLPPNNTFLFHKARANSGTGITYLVDIAHFYGEPGEGLEEYNWTMDLKNLGVVT